MSTLSKILTIVFLIAIAVIIVATFGAVVSPVLFPQVFPKQVDQWSAAGLISTFTGVMAALLAIIGAAVVAFNWLYLEQRVERVLQEKTDDIKRELFASLLERIIAIGEFAIFWQYPLDLRDQYIEQVLQRAPDTPNVAGMMAEEYISFALGVIVGEYFPALQVSNMQRLSRDAALERAVYWAQRAIEAKVSHDPGFPEFVTAKVRALQKEPESTLDCLKQALREDQSFKKRIVMNDLDWSIFTSMTRGESQIIKLDSLLKLLDVERPSLGDVKHHCNNRDKHQRASFAAIKRSDGNYIFVTVEGLKQRHDDPTIKWRIDGCMELQKSVANLDDVMKVIEEVTIPTRLIPEKVY